MGVVGTRFLLIAQKGLVVRGRRITFVLAIGVFVLAGAASADAHPRHHPTFTKQPVATGYDGAVVSGTVESTEAGLDVLRHGGTAADAAVAVASTLGVSDPFVAGIGGGGYFVYYDAAPRQVSTIDGRETAPASDSSTMFIDPHTGQSYSFPTAVTSGLPVGVPGTLATWQRAVRRFGRFSLAEDLRPAIDVAKNGFTVDATFREQVRENAGRFAQFAPTPNACSTDARAGEPRPDAAIRRLFAGHPPVTILSSGRMLNIHRRPAMARLHALPSISGWSGVRHLIAAAENGLQLAARIPGGTSWRQASCSVGRISISLIATRRGRVTM